MPAGRIGFPAPIGGWNARDPLDLMEPTDAIELVNWFPQAGAVYGRGGSVTKLTVSASNPVDTLVPFSNSTANKLLAAANGNIYDITDLATATSLGSGYTSNQWQFAHFNDKVQLVNGADMPRWYDGSAITQSVMAPLGVPVIASVTQSDTGGTLANSTTYTYSVTALLNTGESLPSAEVGVTTSGLGGGAHSVTVNITAVTGATGYKVYGRTAAGELFMATLAAGVIAWVDDGSITPSGALPTVDTNGKNLLGVTNFKGRAFYWANAMAGFFYAAAGAFQGTLSYFPLDYTFREGGYVRLIVTWSRDNGDGVDDLAAFISNNGECLVYQGTDPGSVITWSLVGRFKTGRPLSVRSHEKVASQAVIATMDGFSSMDELIVNQRSQELQSFGGKIIRAANDAASAYQANFGWECTYYPRGQMFLVNVPLAAAQFEQYVKNTNTGSWCRFNGWNARTFCVFGDRLYFGTNDGKVVLADTGSTDGLNAYGDDGVAVERDATTAYLRLTQPGMKSNVTGVQIVCNVFAPSKASVNVFQDYQSRNLPPVATADVGVPNQGIWDVSSWDADYWADGTNVPTNSNARPSLYSVLGHGFAIAVSYRYKFNNQFVVWYSTNLIFRNALGV